MHLNSGCEIDDLLQEFVDVCLFSGSLDCNPYTSGLLAAADEYGFYRLLQPDRTIYIARSNIAWIKKTSHPPAGEEM